VTAIFAFLPIRQTQSHLPRNLSDKVNGVIGLMRIGTNVHSMMAQHRLAGTVQAEEQTSYRLSSGDRVYRAAEDPAGLAISEKLKAKSKSTQMAERNANDGVSLLQVAEGTLQTVHELSGRLRELALQAATSTVGDGERVIINKEYQELKKEIQRTTEAASYNGMNILNGHGGRYDFQIGVNAEKKKDYISYDMNKVMNSINSLGLGGTDVLTMDHSQNVLSSIDQAIEKVSGGRASLGSLVNRMDSAIQNLQMSNEGSEASKSRIRDTDIAKETSNRAVTTIKKNATLALLTQVNKVPQRIQRLVE